MLPTVRISARAIELWCAIVEIRDTTIVLSRGSDLFKFLKGMAPDASRSADNR
jgi:hypothetical protein